LSWLVPILVVGVLAVAVVGYTLKGALLAGDVAGPHAQFELDCNKCHAAWKGPTDRNCQACHVPDEVKNGAVVHYGLVRDHAPGWILPADAAKSSYKMANCAHCHLDHRGRNADLKAQASTDCVLCHGFQTLGARTGRPHPESRALALPIGDNGQPIDALAAWPQTGFRQFLHSKHLNQHLNGDSSQRLLQCEDCHHFDASKRVLLSDDIKFDTKCAACHNSNLAIRHVGQVDKHGDIPRLPDATDYQTRHAAFVQWNSDIACGQCHMLLEVKDPNDPEKITAWKVADTRIVGEWTGRKVQHWGYAEFRHKKHMDPNLAGAAHPLHCVDCHQTSDQYLTLDSPTFDRQCVQCHNGDVALMQRGVPQRQLKHPELPFALPSPPPPQPSPSPLPDNATADQKKAYEDAVAAYNQPIKDYNDKLKALDATQAEANAWAGRDVSSGELLTDEPKKCAMCHQISDDLTTAQDNQMTQPLPLLSAVDVMRKAMAPASYAQLGTESPSPSASASAAPSATESPSGSPSASASPSSAGTPEVTTATAIATPSATAVAPSATTAAPSATAAAADSATPSPSSSASATAAADLEERLEAPPPLPESRWDYLSKFYKLRVIARLHEPASETRFVHKPHITMLAGNNTQNLDTQCLSCHKIIDTGTHVGTGTFDMEVIPSVNRCKECHNSTANGVNNRCGYCHDFHDKSRQAAPTPQLAAPSAMDTHHFDLVASWLHLR
ncbi:MAG: hypothetical protein ACYCW6_04530, partial [Candidatus Xenobia bacterium]